MKILKNKYFLIGCCVVIIGGFFTYRCSDTRDSGNNGEEITLPEKDAVESPADTLTDNPSESETEDTIPARIITPETAIRKKSRKTTSERKITKKEQAAVEDQTELPPLIPENNENPETGKINLPQLKDTIGLIVSDNDITSGDSEGDDYSIIPRKKRKPLKVLGLKIPTQPKQRIDREIRNYLFIPKGQSLGGITVSYYKESTDNYEFLILKDWKGNAITYSISPFFGYFYKDNLAVGGRFSYKNTTINIDELNISLNDDLNFNINGYQYKVESYSATAFHRSYLGLGKSKRLGLFNETNLTYQWGKGTMINHATGDELDGTFQKTKEFQLSINPGLSVFITNNIAVETSIGVAGLKYREIKQEINHVDYGRHKTASADFSLNIFKINLGITVCL